MTREQMYTAQLKQLGIWEEAFAPVVKELAQAERQRQRAQNEWSAEAKAKAEAEGKDPKKAKPDFGSPLWPIIDGLDKKILSYREAMGLTPKSLRRLRGAVPEAPAKDGGISAKLDALLAQAENYDMDSLTWHDEAGQPVSGLSGSALGENVPTVGTGNTSFGPLGHLLLEGKADGEEGGWDE